MVKTRSQTNSEQVNREQKQTPSIKSKMSTASSVTRKKELEFQAAEARAKIELELINKKLELDLAKIDSQEEGSVISDISSQLQVKEWVENNPPCDEKNMNEFELVENSQKPTFNDQTHAQKQSYLQPSYKKAGTSGHMNDTPMTLNNDRLLTRLATKKQLPQFSGDPYEWLLFRQAYYESSHMCGYSDNENMWRLRQCLVGKAREAVSALLIVSMKPEEIMNTLQLRFGRAELIIDKIVAQIKKLPTLPSSYHNEIIDFSTKLNNYIVATNHIEKINYLHSPELTNILLSKLPTNLLARWTDYYYTSAEKNITPKLMLISRFLYAEAEKVSTCGISFINNGYRSYEQKEYKSEQRKFKPILITETEALQTDTDYKPFCKLCKLKHSLLECKKFKRSLVKDRWRIAKSSGVCYKCLISQHDRNTCTASLCDIDACSLPHHRMLHYKVKDTSVLTKEPSQSESITEKVREETVAHATSQNGEILLKVVKVTLFGPNGSATVNCLLDDGSSVSLIDGFLAESIGLTGEKENLRMRSAWGSVIECLSENVKVQLGQGHSNSDKIIFSAKKVPNLMLPIQRLSVLNKISYPHLNKVKNQVSNENIRPLVLIGQDNYHLIAPIETLKGKNNREPYATRTALGWSIHGYVSAKNGASHSVCNISTELYKFDRLIKTSFNIDSIGISKNVRINKDDKRAVEILDNTAVCKENRWEVGLPWKSDCFSMPTSYSGALSRLKTLERKFFRNPNYFEKYKTQINNLITNKYAHELSQEHDEPSTCWYLPHFGVINVNKPDKLRLVFDAAAKVGDYCLNDYLLTGPDMLASLLNILFRFREKRLALIADVKEMFLQIKIRESDMHAQRFLWRESKTEIPKKYVMSSLIFGATCSPFIAQYVKNKNVERFSIQYPEAAEAIRNDCYMDDVLRSEDDEQTAIQQVRDITHIFKEGGFCLRNWNSNSETVLETIPSNYLGKKSIRFNSCESSVERTLGLLWHPKDDVFSFDVSFKRLPKPIVDGEVRPTKRQMVSVVMSVFDVIGFLAPFTIKGKILLQSVCKTGIEWDDLLLDKELEKFKKWLVELKQIENIKIPRFYLSTYKEGIILSRSNILKTELHVFCDSSLLAYGAVAYWRLLLNDGQIVVSLITSKARVAPIKAISIPRLELQAALVGVRLAETVSNAHRYKIDQKYFWCDSITVLCWIKNNNLSKKYNIYVSNRLSEIDNLSEPKEWRYVPTELNIADVITRDNYYSLHNDSEWFKGPKFLLQDDSHWPLDKNTCSTEVEVLLTNTTPTYEYNKPLIPDHSRFSSFLRLKRATAMLFVAVERFNGNKVFINSDLMKRAEIELCKYVQYESFKREITCLRLNTPIPNSSRILKLTPIIDENKLMRVGSRIDAISIVSSDVKRPIILDGKHNITRLIVKYYHQKVAHASNEMVVNELRQLYWIVKLRPTVRSVSSQCLLCRFRRAKPTPPLMGNLPPSRLSYKTRPFSHCALDYFGPLEITVGRRREKRYGVLFTCLSIRAIHLELTTDLTAACTIMALRRMSARRGFPVVLYSDNGTNLHGANNELKRSILDLNHEDFNRFASNQGFEWKYIPPASPHQGGSWERLVRSVKTALRVILKERAPREETLVTLLTEVEHLINSRPLTTVSCDPRDTETLTPNHFLIGTSSGVPLPGKFDDSDLHLRRQWRIAQRLTDLFWQRWLKEYLPTLIPRKKWYTKSRNLKVNDLVLIAEPNMPRNTWLKGIISAVYPGTDEQVRVVDVKTQSGIFRRPAVKIAVLRSVDEC